jgi:hypothetical protein
MKSGVGFPCDGSNAAAILEIKPGRKKTMAIAHMKKWSSSMAPSLRPTPIGGDSVWFVIVNEK